VLIVAGATLGLVVGHSRPTSTEAAGEPMGITVSGPAADAAGQDLTVVATDSTAWLEDEGEGSRSRSELVAVDASGTVRYYNDSHNRYWDVDPVPGTRRTVLYTASDHLDPAACDAGTACTRNVIERVNLTTGTVTRLYARITPHKHSTRWHDVDHVNGSRYAIADIYRDRVAIVDVATGIERWAWNAQSAFELRSGGPFPRDWTHLNDVEVLDDGRLMASVRNHDQVVFLDRERGRQPSWTLGSDDRHETLHMQHNPDYIPAADGGPAVVVGDSENNRVVEYQRENGEWERTWTWQDTRLQWPRDADRLPDGNTLITDSNGDRVIEVNETGAVVWTLEIGFPYEAERLGTGDESTDGPSAQAANLSSSTAVTGAAAAESGGLQRALWQRVKAIVPGPLLNGVFYLVPGWMGAFEALLAVVLVAALLTWGALELRWSPYGVSLRSPIALSRED
jgi:hypothetical protein